VMKVLVTGANGFIGKNLVVHLREKADVEIVTFLHSDALENLPQKIEDVDFIFHLAGINRPKNVSEFTEGNCELTRILCDSVKKCGRLVPIIYTSSIHADRDNAYGNSKRAAEEALFSLTRETATPTYVYRLPNVFGKWCKPNYNSAVATFSYNIAHDLPIQINDPLSVIQLVYVDDLIADFLKIMDGQAVQGYQEINSVHSITVGELAQQLLKFKESRSSLLIGSVGTGLTRALYSTFISYFTPEQFSYPLVKHEDARGVFVEMLKTRDTGQFSYFTAHPGVTRGGHYHHSKNEKFLVIQGKARFGFRHIVTDESYEIFTEGETQQVVETVPGWSHDIKNVGDNEMIVMLWANEIFDSQHPDTVTFKV
jgi:UDP-2-acetamido-2,6-beta-L-arabino-hexul-4-ose reductase